MLKNFLRERKHVNNKKEQDRIVLSRVQSLVTGLSWIWLGQCQTSSLSSSRKPVWGYQWSTVHGCLSLAWLHLGRSSLSVPCWLFISTKLRGGSSNVCMYLSYHLHLSLSMVLPLVLNSPLPHLFLRELLVQLGKCSPWMGPWTCCSDTREDSGATHLDRYFQ